MPATPSEIDVIPPTLPGFLSPVPVTVRIRNLAGADATTYTTFNGSTAHPVAARITGLTSFFFEGGINSGPWVVTCTTDGGQVVANQTLVTGPTFNPAVVQCVNPIDAGPELVTFSFPSTWTAVRGSPVVAGSGSGTVEADYQAALFDAAASETMLAWLVVPTGATIVDIDLYWTNAGAGTGDVLWQIAQSRQFIAGATLASNDIGTATVTVAAPLLDIPLVTTLRSGVAVGASGLMRVSLNRNGADAADTLANDAAALALAVRRVL